MGTFSSNNDLDLSTGSIDTGDTANTGGQGTGSGANGNPAGQGQQGAGQEGQQGQGEGANTGTVDNGGETKKDNRDKEKDSKEAPLRGKKWYYQKVIL